MGASATITKPLPCKLILKQGKEPTMGMTDEEKRRDILDAQHKKAQLDLDETIDSNNQRQQRKAVMQRANAERQAGFVAGKKGRQKAFETCTHRQGGIPNQPSKTRAPNPSLLTVMRMPDGFTKVIACSACRGQRATPHPYLRRTDPFPAGFHMPSGVILERAETSQEVKARLKKYAEDTEEFKALLELAQDKLTDVPEMDCGTTHDLINSETGMKVYPWRPFDVWPYVQAAA